MDFIHILEKELSIPFKYNFMPSQKGDVVVTYADTKAIENLVIKPRLL